MFIFSRNHVRLPSKDGSLSFDVPRGYIGEVPEWAADTKYFRALVADGKISLPKSTADKDVVPETEKKTTTRRAKE